MRMSNRRFSIKMGIRVSLLVVFLLIATIIASYYGGILSYSKESLDKSHVELTALINRQLDSLLTLSDSAIKRAIYSAGVQGVVFAEHPLEYLKNRPSAMSFLDNMVYNNVLIRDIYLSCEGGYSLFYVTEWDTRRHYAQLIREELAAGKHLPHFFTSIHDGVSGGQPVTEFLYYTPVYNARMALMSGMRLAHCIAVCDMTAFVRILSTGLYEDETIALIYDGEIIASNRTITPAQATALKKPEMPGTFSGTVTIDSVRYLEDSLLLPDIDAWSVVYLVPEESVLGSIIFVRNISIAVLFVSLITLTTCLELFMRAIYTQVGALSKGIQAVQLGDTTCVALPNLVELMPLATHFNTTVAALLDAQEKENQMTHALYQSIIERQQATINAYRYQITPHFLYNVMETMRSMAHSYGVDTLERLIRATSTFLRYTLRESACVKLEKELEFVSGYFDIMDIRFPGCYALRMGATKEALACDILTTALQPLVENCIAHAVRPTRSQLLIAIQASATWAQGKKYLTIKVADNGRGIQADALEALLEYMRRRNTDDTQIHIGLNNVYHRLLLYFGSDFSMDIRTKLDHYTVVTINIPQAT